jgi:PAS domain S-box-containing protein
MVGTCLDITARKQMEAERDEAIADLRAQRDRLDALVVERTGEAHRIASELETILDAIPGLVFHKDTRNRFLRVNKYVADAHRCDKSEMVGKDCFDLYPRDQAQAYWDDDLAVIRSRQPRIGIDEPWRTAAGTRWVSTSKIPQFDASGTVTGIIGVSIDVTRRKQAEEAAARRTLLTDGVNRILREAVNCETEEEVARTTLRVAEELTASRFGWVGLLNASGLMDTVAISNPGWEACAIVVADSRKFIKNMPLRGIDRTTLKEGKPRIVNADQIDSHPDRVGTPPGHPKITCFLGVPFKDGERTVGMIGLANKVGGFAQEDVEAIDAVAKAFYQAILRKRMERQIRDHGALQAGLAELASRVRGDPSTGDLGRAILSFLCGQFRLRCCTWWRTAATCTWRQAMPARTWPGSRNGSGPGRDSWARPPSNGGNWYSTIFRTPILPWVPGLEKRSRAASS